MVQMYLIQGFKMESNNNGVVILKKKGYNTVILVLLILFVMIIGGIIYYLLCEDEMVIIKNVGDESDNSKSLPKSEITGYCSDCGFPLTKNNVFCVGCGKKIITDDENSDLEKEKCGNNKLDKE